MMPSSYDEWKTDPEFDQRPVRQDRDPDDARDDQQDRDMDDSDREWGDE